MDTGFLLISIGCIQKVMKDRQHMLKQCLVGGEGSTLEVRRDGYTDTPSECSLLCHIREDALSARRSGCKDHMHDVKLSQLHFQEKHTHLRMDSNHA